MEGRLIKIDKNGSKHFEGYITCDRCDGKGIYYIGVCNGELVPSHIDEGICFKCGGAGKVMGKWIERTAEYQAKLDAKREAKRAKEQAEREAQEAERQAKEEAEKAEKAAEEARIKAQKAISQYVGEIGDKIEFKGEYVKSGSWESHMGWMTTTMYAHTFKDVDGNVFVWKTQTACAMNYGEPVHLTGTVKNHSEYKDEKQTELKRCKFLAIA